MNRLVVFPARTGHTPVLPTATRACGLVLALTLVAACGSERVPGSESRPSSSEGIPAEADGSSAAPNTSGTAAPTAAPGETATTSFTLTSPVITADGSLPVEFTCDGAAETPPLAWSGAPKGTASYAVVMHHVAGPGDVHWYWVLYDISPSIDRLDAATPPPAVIGTNSVNDRTEYAPPCSKGPGKKVYTFTVYALSARPNLPDQARVSRPVLLEALAGLILGEATLDVTYERTGAGTPGGSVATPTGQGGPPR